MRKKKSQGYSEFFEEKLSTRRSCKDCLCSSCTQQENCAMNGCDGGGCTDEELDYFKDTCDDYEPCP